MTALTSLDHSGEKSEAHCRSTRSDTDIWQVPWEPHYRSVLDFARFAFQSSKTQSKHFRLGINGNFSSIAIHFTRLDGFQILVELIKHFFLLNREMRSKARKGDESRNWFLCFLHENCIIYEGKVLLIGACRCICRKATKVWKFFVFYKTMLSWNLNFCEKSNKKLKQQRRVDRPSSNARSFFLCHMINNCRSVNSPLSSLHECLINDKNQHRQRFSAA